MEPDFEILSAIKKVEVQPFLYTRIQQKIEERKRSTLKPIVGWAFATAIAVIFTIDFFVIQNYKSENKSNITETMSLMPQNQIY